MQLNVGRPRAVEKVGRSCLLIVLAVLGHGALANGLDESGAWQYRTDAARASLLGAVDLIERRQNGYYDSFGTVVNNVTTTTNTLTTNSTTITSIDIGCAQEAISSGNVAVIEQSASASDIDATSSTTLIASNTNTQVSTLTGGDGATTTAIQTSDMAATVALDQDVRNDVQVGVTGTIEQGAGIANSTACAIDFAGGQNAPLN